MEEGVVGVAPVLQPGVGQGTRPSQQQGRQVLLQLALQCQALRLGQGGDGGAWIQALGPLQVQVWLLPRGPGLQPLPPLAQPLAALLQLAAGPQTLKGLGVK